MIKPKYVIEDTLMATIKRKHVTTLPNWATAPTVIDANFSINHPQTPNKVVRRAATAKYPNLKSQL